MEQTKPEFVNRNTVPPGGLWYYRVAGESCSSPDYYAAVEKTAELMKKHGISGDPADALAAFMCPLMPDWFCRGTVRTAAVPLSAALTAAKPYFGMSVETSDVIMSRLAACAKCPRFRKDFCVHCLRADDSVYEGFGGRRMRLPGDASSGVCECAATLNMVVASVVYPSGSEVWKGTPATCWRNVK